MSLTNQQRLYASAWGLTMLPQNYGAKMYDGHIPLCSPPDRTCKPLQLALKKDLAAGLEQIGLHDFLRSPAMALIFTSTRDCS